MISFQETDLIRYNQLGIIPGPREKESDFIQRAESCLNLRKCIERELGSTLPLKQEELASYEIFHNPLRETERLWGIRPDWIPLFFSNYRLLPWHGGCAWIFQLTPQDSLMALFQLRSAFAHKERYLGLYQRDELVAHELCHIGRMCFQEPRFEEIIAYQSSKSWFRRCFGPLFQSSIETVIFLVALLLVLFVDAYALFSWGQEGYAQVASLKLLPIAMVAFGLGRLGRRQMQFRRCRENLRTFFKDHTRADHVMFRLTDREIVAFGNRDATAEYGKFDDGSLRWRLLKAVYFG